MRPSLPCGTKSARRLEQRPNRVGIYVKRMLGLFGYVGWLLSPSRKIIDLWKQGDRTHRGSALRRWSFWLFGIDVVGCISLTILAVHAPSIDLSFIGAVAVVYAYSRINEIAYAF